jgi:hypothetical protein
MQDNDDLLFNISNYLKDEKKHHPLRIVFKRSKKRKNI